MWFKNIFIYRTSGWSMSKNDLENALAGMRLRECSELESKTIGWLPVNDTENFVHSMNKQLLICLGMNKKILPSAVIRKRVSVHAKEMALSQGYDVSRKQLKDIKDLVTEELLSQAFSVETKVYGWIDPINNWLVINATSQSKADDFLQELVKAIRDTQISFLRTMLSPSKAMKDWLMSKSLSPTFTINSDCELAAPGFESKSVKYQGYSFSDNDVQKLLKEGMEVKRLALTWSNKISFVLNNNLQLKKIIASVELRETYLESEDLFSAEFAVMTTEFNLLFNAIVGIMDGEATLK